MRIRFDKLRDAGFHVEADEAGVDIHGSGLFPYELLRKLLTQFNLTESQIDLMLGETVGQIELHQIFNALR